MSYFLCKHIETITLVVGILTLAVAYFIPKRILLNQLYADLVSQYRSPEMGYAVLSIFDFYKNDCQNTPDLIRARYIERYDREIAVPLWQKQAIDPAKTLHFQRRLVAYFYWDLAKLYFENKPFGISKKKLNQMIEENERNLISLVLQMSEANESRFVNCDNIAEPPDDDVKMNQFIKRLYDETEGWE